MKEILKTKLLEYEKSTFLIDLVKHDGSSLYVSILQTIQQGSLHPTQQEIKINPSVLSDIIKVLQEYQKVLPKTDDSRQQFLSNSQRDSIQSIYLKGGSIKDLALQFDCKEELIKQILYNSNIEIVANNSKPPFKRFRRRK